MKMKLATGLALAVLFFLGNARAADTPTALPRAELDRRLADSLRNAINIGATIFNAGNEEGCYRIYEGALTMAVPLLDHRPELKKLVEEKMAQAKRTEFVADRAFVLRGAIDAIRVAINGPGARKTAQAPKVDLQKPLWDRLGGQTKVKAIVHDFVQLVASDPKVNFTRNGKYKLDEKAVANLEQKLVALISANSDGPQLAYTGNPNMKEVHKGMAITGDEFDAMIADLITTLKKLGVPQKDTNELVAGFAAYKILIVDKSASPARDRTRSPSRCGNAWAAKSR